MPGAAAPLASSLAQAPNRPSPRLRAHTSHQRSRSLRSAAWQRRHGMSGGAPPPGRRSDEALPLFAADASPTMASLKHRAAQGSLGDITVPHALADERGGSSGPAPTAGLAPLVLLCVAAASMGAFTFGYALGVVNGPLGALSTSLGFGGDAFRQGLVSGWVRGPSDGSWLQSGGRCAPTHWLHAAACRLSLLETPPVDARPPNAVHSPMLLLTVASPLPPLLQVVSSVLAGAAVGSVAGSGLADSLGRKKAFLLDSIPLLAGALVCASAQGLAGMIAGRLLTGIGIGLSSALVPLYISEVGLVQLNRASCWIA